MNASPPQPGFAGVLFDIDDTLYEVASLAKAAWLAAAGELAEVGLVAAAVVDAYEQVRVGLSCRQALEATLAVLARPDVDPNFLLALIEGPVPDALPARPGALAMLTSLRQAGVRLGALTNGDGQRQRAKVAALGMSDLFEAVVVGGEVCPLKPDPAGFAMACTQLGLAPAQVLFVGDRPDFDVAPALVAGMGAVRLRAGHYASLPPAPGTLFETADPALLWSAVQSLAGVLPGVSAAGVLSLPVVSTLVDVASGVQVPLLTVA